MHDFGKINAEHQKVVIPEMIVLSRSNMPEKDNDFTDQDEKRFLICYSRGSQLVRFSFLEFRGTPRYLTGSVPQVIPVEALIVSIS